MIGVLHIVVARKPVEGTVAGNCLRWGCGALWIDGTRIAGMAGSGHWTHKREIGDGNIYHGGGREEIDYGKENPAFGRFPANLILQNNEEIIRGFPMTTSGGGNKNTSNRNNGITIGNGLGKGNGLGVGGDSGSASRFFFNYSEQESIE
jgi:site-specific DNA-methyltransferase (adenine-specific)